MKKSTSSIPLLTMDDCKVINAKNKAIALNGQYQSVFTVEDLTNMPEIGTGNFHTMQPIQFSESGIQTLLQNLNANKAPGPDGIHPLVLKHCSYKLALILKVIFRQSLNTGNIPSDWLLANVISVYKRGSKNLPVNYRPISLTSICSKVMEHIIYHSMMSHLNRNNVLSGSQHGFRAGYSCSTHL